MKLTNQIFSEILQTSERMIELNERTLTQLFNDLLHRIAFYYFVAQRESESEHMRMPSTSNEIIVLEKFSISQFQNDDDRYKFDKQFFIFGKKLNLSQ